MALLLNDHAAVEGATTPVAIKGNEAPVLLGQVNVNRTELWLHNSSASVLYIGLTDNISTDVYALRIASFDTLILNANNYASLYKREIYGFWANGASSTSKCMVTEYYKQ